MALSDFTDYYEILEVSPNAQAGTIERMFRYLAHLYHPDNRETGDRSHFDAVMEAHNALRDPAKRAQYDVERKSRVDGHANLGKVFKDSDGIGQGVDIQSRLLSLLYVRCRQSVRQPGMGDIELENLSGCPAEHLEFHLWYLKEKGWIRRIEDGTFAITVEGVDRANTEHDRKVAQHLLTNQSR